MYALLGDIVLPKLLEWVRFHFPKFDRNAATMLTSELEGLSSNALYWETVYGSLLQGRIDVVRALLRLHSNANNDTFRLVDETLKTMPVYSVRLKSPNVFIPPQKKKTIFIADFWWVISNRIQFTTTTVGCGHKSQNRCKTIHFRRETQSYYACKWLQIRF